MDWHVHSLACFWVPVEGLLHPHSMLLAVPRPRPVGMVPLPRVGALGLGPSPRDQIRAGVFRNAPLAIMMPTIPVQASQNTPGSGATNASLSPLSDMEPDASSVEPSKNACPVLIVSCTSDPPQNLRVHISPVISAVSV